MTSTARMKPQYIGCARHLLKPAAMRMTQVVVRRAASFRQFDVSRGYCIIQRMSQASQLSPELAQGLLTLARSLVAAIRNWSLYPAEHPAVAQSLERLCASIRDTTGGAILAIAVTPDTLVIEGAAADRTNTAIAEAAALLHDRDILELTFLGEIPTESIRALLTLLTLGAQERRDRGGPAKMWADAGHPSIALKEVDYRQVLARETAGSGDAAPHDDVWQSIVMSIAGGHSGSFDDLTRQRLLAIAGSPAEIGDLANAVMGPKCAADGSPMVTSQAATVLAAFRHLSSVMTAASPERMPEVMRNLAGAASRLEPHVVMQLLTTAEDPNDQLAVVHGLNEAFDDAKVAQLLATTLAIDGHASDRLATIFNTIASDSDRKRRVLTLTRSMLSETTFGRASQFESLWTSMQELLVSYNDTLFVSESYRAALDGVGGRAERMAHADLPPELPTWLDTLGEQNVRALSVTLLVDLLNLETDADRAAEIAGDLAALAENLLMSGAYNDALVVTTTLADRGSRAAAIGRDACRRALNELGESPAMRETAALVGDLDEPSWVTLRAVIQLVGPTSVEALKPVVAVEHDTDAARRAEDVIVQFGVPAVARLASLAGDSQWFVQCAAARLLGRIASPEAVPILLPLLRRGDPRVARAAVAALGAIEDPSAARAIQTVLRAATGDVRQAVVEALVADRDPRIVPILARIISESDPVGSDHPVVIHALTALATVHGDEAIPAIVAVIGRRGWFRRRKLKALKTAGVAALRAMGTAKASAALDDAGRHGDRMLRQVVGDGPTRL
jgi:hypothetical protein